MENKSFTKIQNLINNIQQNISQGIENESNALKVLVANKQSEILAVVLNELTQNKNYYFEEPVKEEKEKK